MKIIKSLEEFQKQSSPLVVALGNFDGVHLGHQKLISTAKQIANQLNGRLLVFTFYPHPQIAFGKKIALLNSFQQKVANLEKLAVDILLAVPFTKEFSQLSPQQFVSDILLELLQAKHIVAGFNYSFGYKGQGKIEDLKKLTERWEIGHTIIDPFYIDNELVSSTAIRNYLLEGDIKKAVRLLGYHPKIVGTVISGNKLGREMGFPTANLKWEEKLLIPQRGVYAVKVIYQGQYYKGVLNIGYKPTVTSKKQKTIEVNILNFCENIYHKKLEIIFYDRIRNEKKFSTVEQLKQQIKMDILQARKILI